MILNASINTITRGDAGRTSRNWLGLERMFCGDFESSSESTTQVPQLLPMALGFWTKQQVRAPENQQWLRSFFVNCDALPRVLTQVHIPLGIQKLQLEVAESFMVFCMVASQKTRRIQSRAHWAPPAVCATQLHRQGLHQPKRRWSMIGLCGTR